MHLAFRKAAIKTLISIINIVTILNYIILYYLIYFTIILLVFFNTLDIAQLHLRTAGKISRCSSTMKKKKMSVNSSEVNCMDTTNNSNDRLSSNSDSDKELLNWY